jgi:hypothetical protein
MKNQVILVFVVAGDTDMRFHGPLQRVDHLQEEVSKEEVELGSLDQLS